MKVDKKIEELKERVRELLVDLVKKYRIDEKELNELFDAIIAAEEIEKEKYYEMVQKMDDWKAKRILLKFWLLVNEGRDTVD